MRRLIVTRRSLGATAATVTAALLLGACSSGTSSSASSSAFLGASSSSGAAGSAGPTATNDGVATTVGNVLVTAPVAKQDADLVVRLHSDTPADSVDAAVEALSDAGIPVYDSPSAGSPVRPVQGTTSPLHVLRWQARAMGLELTRGFMDGIAGATVDATTPMPAGAPPFTYFVAAWIRDGQSRGAQIARAVMGTRDWTAAPRFVYPELVLALFTSDLTQAIGEDTAGATVPPKVPVSPIPTGTAQAMAGTSVLRAETVRAPAVAAGGVCSAISGFFNGIMDTIANALKVDPAGLGGSAAGKVGSFFLGLWNAAVDVARAVVNGIVTTLAAPVINAIRAAVGVIGVVQMVVSTIKPVSAHLEGVPSLVRFQVDQAPDVPFIINVVADPGIEKQFQVPSFVSDCAGAVGTPLPSLSGEGTPVDWTLQDTDNLLTVQSPAGPPYKNKLDATNMADITLVPGRETSKDQYDEIPTDVTLKATVGTTALQKLRDFIVGALTAQVPGVIRGVVQPIIKAALDKVLSYINEPGSATATIEIWHSKHVTCTSG